MRRFQTPLPWKTGNKHLYQNMPIETAFGCQRARSALSKSVLKLRHNTLILLPNTAEMDTTCCLQLWEESVWNCSASDKILNNVRSALLSFQEWLSMWHLPSGTPSKAREAQGHSLAQGCTRQGCSRVEASKGSPSPEESEDPVILSNILRAMLLQPPEMRELTTETPVGSLQQNKGKSRDFGWLELSDSQSLQFVPAGPLVPKLTAMSCPAQLSLCSCQSLAWQQKLPKGLCWCITLLKSSAFLHSCQLHNLKAHQEPNF